MNFNPPKISYFEIKLFLHIVFMSKVANNTMVKLILTKTHV
jgi:hypothetical protein